MSRSPYTRVLFTASVLLAGLLLTVGCGSDRTTGPAGPQTVSDASGFVSVPGDELLAAPMGRGGNGNGPGQNPQEVGGSGPTSMAVVRATASRMIDGSVGGTLSAGLFTVTIPPGAFQGVRNIQIFDTSYPYVECRLLPEGLTFDVPVTLTIDLAPTTGDHPGITVLWYDPDQVIDHWVDMGGTYSAEDHSVSTQLAHFSTYRPCACGRGGW